jgi:branched-chain amino acid transport system substrate-binding protein
MRSQSWSVRIFVLPWKLTPLLCLLVFAGCLGDANDEPRRVTGNSATVYVSVPRAGVAAAAGRAIEAGARLALADAGGRAGDLKIRLRTLSSTEPGGQVWKPDVVHANADRAVEDPHAIAYLGELGFGGSAVSLPVTNGGRLLQVSPTDGLTSLTRIPPGRPRSDPVRLRPEGERNFARLTPSDLLLTEVVLELMRERGTEDFAVIFDQEVYGRELAAQLVARGRRDGPEPLRTEEYRGKVDEIPDMVEAIAAGRPGAVVIAGVAGPGTGRMLSAIDARLPGVPVYATSGMLERDPRRPIPDAPLSVEALSPVLPVSELPARGREVMRRAGKLAGPEAARPEAAYAYEAMRLILDAIEAGGRDRARVAAAALAMRDRRSVIGPYRLRGTGDVDGTRFGLYALENGRFRFVRIED